VLGRVAILAIVLSSATARAEDDATDPEQVVVVNTAAKLGDIGQIDRLKRMLLSRGLLYKLPEKLEAQLDGRNVLLADLDQIKEAYANGEYATAKKAIDADEKRILEQAANGDPVPALAQLAQWRGMIAAQTGEQEEALRQFRCAYRLNPAWAPDKRLVSPRMRAIIKRAHAEPSETGVLKVEVDPDEAKVQIDGGEAKPARGKLSLPIGLHLVQIVAPERAPYAELVDITQERQSHIEIALDKESTYDRAARLVDETAAAPAGKPRLKSARGLAKLTGRSRLLFIEDGGDDHIVVRLYDIDSHKVSNQIQLDEDAPSSALAQKIKAALDPDNMIDVSAVAVISRTNESKHWYERWYVWAGVAAVGLSAVGGYEAYSYATRPATSLRFGAR
jgi:hypothetical protein